MLSSTGRWTEEDSQSPSASAPFNLAGPSFRPSQELDLLCSPDLSVRAKYAEEILVPLLIPNVHFFDKVDSKMSLLDNFISSQ